MSTTWSLKMCALLNLLSGRCDMGVYRLYIGRIVPSAPPPYRGVNKRLIRCEYTLNLGVFCVAALIMMHKGP